MREFVEYLVKSIAKNPDDVVVEEKQLDETYIKEEITVHPDDMGLVIGRDGRTIRSVRELAKAKAIKENVKVDVELLEPDRGERSEPAEEAETETSKEESMIDEVEAEVNEMAEELMNMVSEEESEEETEE